MEGQITYWNQSAERIYGWKEVEAIAQSVDRILGGNAAQLERAMISLKERSEWVGELCQIRRDGSEIVVESRWTLVREHGDKDQARLMINTDITERKKLEAQFLRAQRMESIGALAGGIAHDLNNIFTPILMGAELLGEEIDAKDRRKMLATLKGCAQRGSEMVKQILSFARGVGGQTGPLDFNAVVNDMVRFVKETFPRTVQLEVNVEPDLPQVVGNSTQLHQILLNLCVNARDAMPNGGRIELTAKKELLKAYVVRGQPQPVSGVYVILSVSDTGSGISPAVLDRIFEPFFTTKSAGKGTGLGLSTVMSIAKSHSGFVEVSSTVGKGTTFRVYLPGVQSTNSLIQLEKTRELTGHGEQILVVDDEIAFLEMTRESLEAFNYKVLVAHNGAEAVAAYQQHHKEIHAVITDMRMPIMDGPASIEVLLQINPAVKIIGLSGFGSEPAAIRAARLKVRSFLRKPYETSELLSRVAEVLNGHRS